MESRMTSAPPADELNEKTASKMVSDLKAMIQKAEEKAVERAKAADRVVRDHPYETMGLAFGLGVLIGILARRK